jgi:hypothetical protein
MQTSTSKWHCQGPGQLSQFCQSQLPLDRTADFEGSPKAWGNETSTTSHIALLLRTHTVPCHYAASYLDLCSEEGAFNILAQLPQSLFKY